MFQGFALCIEVFSLGNNQAKSLQDIQARNRADAYSKNVRPTVFLSAASLVSGSSIAKLIRRVGARSGLKATRKMVA
jgi:hypothetical protein